MANDSYGTFFSGTKIPYDPLWEGPLKKNRHCTNRFWLITFCTFFFVWMIIVIHAFSNGDIRKLIVPADSEGRKCGIDSDVQDKPYLVFFDLTKCIEGLCDTTQVCQTECPSENFLYLKNQSIEHIKQKIICTIDVNKNLITSFPQLDFFINQNKCTKWYLKSKSVAKRCIPEIPVPDEYNSTISNDQLKNATQTILQLANLEEKFEHIYHDIIATRYPVFGFIALSGVTAFLYIILLIWLAKPFVYTSIFMICAFLTYFTYESYLQYSIKNSTDWLYLSILSILLLIVIIISTVMLRHKIYLACQIIKESSRAVISIWSTLIFPIVPWMLHLLVALLSITVLLYLQTIKISDYKVHFQEMINDDDRCICPTELNYIENATCDPNIFKSQCKNISGGPCLSAGCYLTKTVTPNQVYIYHLINGIAFVWFSLFVSAFGQMVLAVTFATWYWTFIKQNVSNFTVPKSSWITIRYHIGTLAFGSSIMWICNIVRFIFKPIIGNTQSNGAMSVQPIGCIRSMIEYLMSFLQYINYNAYIMCAIHGKGFCRSAKDAFNLLMRNIVRVVVINNITNWLLKIAKYFIIALTVALTMAYYKNKDTKEVIDFKVPIIMAFIGSYIITTGFFAIHKAAVDTLFLCFLEDSERNDGTQERPYYMSIRLKKLLQK